MLVVGFGNRSLEEDEREKERSQVIALTDRNVSCDACRHVLLCRE